VAFGAVSMIAGVVVLAWPGATAAVIAIIFALNVLLSGILRVVAAVGSEEAGGGGRALLAVLGIMSILVGLLCLRHPFQTVGVLVVLFGLFWIVTGVLETVHAAGSKGMPRRGWAIAAGLLSVVAGIVVLSFTAASVLALVWLLGLQLLIYGAMTISHGWQLRRADHSVTVPSGHRTAYP
jgi:uncharacterized membrane protein HdeD (DUF308 family)